MDRKTKKAIAAWKQVMQRDLDSLNELSSKDGWQSEDLNRIGRIKDCLDKAVILVNQEYDVCTSFSRGKQVVMQTVDKHGCLVTL